MSADNPFPEQIDLYQVLVTNFPNGSIFVFDHDLNYLLAGGQILEKYGLSPEMFKGKHLYGVLSQASWGPVEPHLRAALGGESRSFLGVAGSWHYQAFAYPIFDTSGTIVACALIAQDITILKTKEAQLERRAHFERLIADISSRFIHLSPDAFNTVMQAALADLARFIDADRAYLSVMNPERSQLQPFFEWRAEGIAPRSEQLRFATNLNLRKMAEDLIARGIVYFPDIEALPYTEPARDLYLPNQVRSVLMIPVMGSSQSVTILGFHTVRRPSNWDESDVALLKILAEILASTLEKFQAERALRESEERLRVVVSNAPMLVFTFDAAGNNTFLAGQRLEPMRINAHAALGMNINDMPDPVFAANIRRALSGEEFSSVDFKRLAGGETYTFQGWYGPLRKPTGEIDGAIGVALDISDRVQVEEAAQRQRQLSDALRETSAAIAQSIELDQVLQHILEAVDRVVPADAGTIALVDGDAFQLKQYRGRHSELPPEVRNSIRLPLDTQTIRTMLETRQPYLIADVQQLPGWAIVPGLEWIRSYMGVPICSKDEVIGVLNLDSAQVGFFTEADAERLQTFADHVSVAVQNARLFERVRQSAAELEKRVKDRTADLEGQQAQLQAILDSITEAVIYGTLDTQPRALYVNHACTVMTGYTAEELISDPDVFFRWVHQSVNTSADILKILASLIKRGIWERDTVLIRKDGSEFDAHVTICTVAVLNPETVQMVALVRDIRQEKALQQQKDRFIANASHELRTPLTNLKMRLYLMTRQPQLMHDHMEVMERVTQRMQELIDDLLDVSRFDRGIVIMERQRVVLQNLINEALEVQHPHAELKSIYLRTELPAEPLVNYVDPGRIGQVITNLVVNALNYTPDSGRITVRLWLDSAPDRTYSVIEVQDTGIGIPAESLSHVFEPFFRTNVGVVRGTGLGLTICREIIELHGGTLSVISQQNIGSTFTVRLPIVETQSETVDEIGAIGFPED